MFKLASFRLSNFTIPLVALGCLTPSNTSLHDTSLPASPAVTRMLQTPHMAFGRDAQKKGLYNYRSYTRDQFIGVLKKTDSKSVETLLAVEALIKRGDIKTLQALKAQAREGAPHEANRAWQNTLTIDDIKLMTEFTHELGYSPSGIVTKNFRNDLISRPPLIVRAPEPQLSVEELHNVRLLFKRLQKDKETLGLLHNLASKKKGVQFGKLNGRDVVTESFLEEVADAFQEVGMGVTKGGIRRFQSLMRLSATGELNDATQSKMVHTLRDMRKASKVLGIPFVCRRIPVTEIVLHDTESGTASAALNGLRDRQLGYHYIIGREKNGRCPVVKVIDPHWETYHAKCANEGTIGIAFVGGGQFGPATAEQIKTAEDLIRGLKKRFPRLKYIRGHKQIYIGSEICGKPDPEGVSMQSFASQCGLTVPAEKLGIKLQMERYYLTLSKVAVQSIGSND